MPLPSFRKELLINNNLPFFFSLILTFTYQLYMYGHELCLLLFFTHFCSCLSSCKLTGIFVPLFFYSDIPLCMFCMSILVRFSSGVYLPDLKSLLAWEYQLMNPILILIVILSVIYVWFIPNLVLLQQWYFKIIWNDQTIHAMKSTTKRRTKFHFFFTPYILQRPNPLKFSALLLMGAYYSRNRNKVKKNIYKNRYSSSCTVRK